MSGPRSSWSPLVISAFSTLQCSHLASRQFQAIIPVEGWAIQLDEWMSSFNSSLVALAQSTTESSSYFIGWIAVLFMCTLPMLTSPCSLQTCTPVLLNSDIQSPHCLSCRPCCSCRGCDTPSWPAFPSLRAGFFTLWSAWSRGSIHT